MWWWGARAGAGAGGEWGAGGGAGAACGGGAQGPEQEQEESAGLVAELRAHLSARMPEYMVPAAFVMLESLPLTPNGKLDRRALPAPDGEAYARQAYEAPQGEIEATLASIWSQLLRVERIGRHDNFFELGGHSLLAGRLISRVGESLGVELPLTELFARPTLAALSEAVVATRWRSSFTALPAIEPV